MTVKVDPVTPDTTTTEPTAPHKYARQFDTPLRRCQSIPDDIIGTAEIAERLEGTTTGVLAAAVGGRLPKPVGLYRIHSFPRFETYGWDRAEIEEALKTFRFERRGRRAGKLKRAGK